MIALTPLTSWLLVAVLAANAVIIAIVVARAWDAADDRRSMEQWRAMCDELELWDVKQEWTWLSAQRDRLERPYNWEEHDD